MEKYYPCDTGYCPYGADHAYQCRDYCGLGVDDNESEMENEEDDD